MLTYAALDAVSDLAKFPVSCSTTLCLPTPLLIVNGTVPPL